MKLEQQVISLELAKKLKELGVKQESYFHWRESLKKEIALSRAKNGKYISGLICSAFTVAELGEMLPSNTKNRDWFPMKEENGEWLVWERQEGLYTKEGNEFPNEITEADARAKILIYLLENNLITKEDNK